MKLVIVESPTKAKTISKYLGSDYVVKASYGHVVDLPKKTLGVDLENNFTPTYEVTLRGKKTLAEIKKLAKDATEIYIATDPDREGEAIGFNLLEQIKSSNSRPKGGRPMGETVKRIQFHEITKKAIQVALEHPTEINIDLVDSQQARRVLDRLVGYKLSPLLWTKVRYGLSAGRVQSVAVRLIVERERERQAFKPQEYWEVEGSFGAEEKRGQTPMKVFSGTVLGSDPNEILTQLKKINGKDFLIDSKEKADSIVNDIKLCEHKVASVESKEVKKYPHPPFTTSTLQQSASNLLGFSAKRTMSAAQKLFELGQITYHRTDSCNLSPSCVASIRGYVVKTFGASFVPQSAVFYKTKSKNAQEAHEAIRPTDVGSSKFKVQSSKKTKLVKFRPEGDPPLAGDKFGEDMGKLYDLIWRRAVSCQMVPALYNQLTVRILSSKVGSSLQAEARSLKIEDRVEARKWKLDENKEIGEAREYLFVNSEQVLKFSGFLAVYHASSVSLPLNIPKIPNSPISFTPNQLLNLLNIMPSQHFTQPPARYQTASLIKVLEEFGIGRPSTYASTIATIESRGYVLREGRYFYPDDVAFVVVDLLVANFPEVIDVKFTAGMEENLDKIALGKLSWVPVIKEFWDPFVIDLKKAQENLKKSDFTTLAPSNEKCPDCGANLVVKLGRFGKFLSCSKFPDCKFMKAIIEETGNACPDCKIGRVIVRRTKKGKTFYGCSKYPECKWASWEKPVLLQ